MNCSTGGCRTALELYSCGGDSSNPPLMVCSSTNGIVSCASQSQAIVGYAPQIAVYGHGCTTPGYFSVSAAGTNGIGVCICVPAGCGCQALQMDGYAGYTSCLALANDTDLTYKKWVVDCIAAIPAPAQYWSCASGCLYPTTVGDRIVRITSCNSECGVQLWSCLANCGLVSCVGCPGIFGATRCYAIIGCAIGADGGSGSHYGVAGFAHFEAVYGCACCDCGVVGCTAHSFGVYGYAACNSAGYFELGTGMTTGVGVQICVPAGCGCVGIQTNGHIYTCANICSAIVCPSGICSHLGSGTMPIYAQYAGMCILAGADVRISAGGSICLFPSASVSVSGPVIATTCVQGATICSSGSVYGVGYYTGATPGATFAFVDCAGGTHCVCNGLIVS
jgi:hypothetical protein